MWNEFKQFAVKGNVLDLAVGVVIGGAFGKIVTSLVNDLIMPIVGLLLGGIDFSELSLSVGDAAIKYGAFIQSIVDFFIVSFSIFMFIKLINSMKHEEKKAEEPQAKLKLTREEILLTEIRDLLAK